MKKSLLLLVPLVFLAGCEEDDRRIAKLMATPEIVKIGVFEDCNVSFVNRGTNFNSFYLARCPAEASTTTRNYEEQSGKTRISRRDTSIVSGVSEEEQRRIDEEIARQKRIQKIKESALSKLTPEEANVLLTR